MMLEKFVVAIRANGKILRETKDIVKLPFGSEFSILVKNLNSRRAKFTLHIDGADVLDGTKIIVNAGEETELKRFIRNGNMNEGNAFKFIKRTAAIEDGPRGIRLEDGLIRIVVWFEKEKPIVTTTIHDNVYRYSGYHPWNRPYWYDQPFYSISNQTGVNNVLRGYAQNATLTTSSASTTSVNTVVTTQLADIETALNDVGITVPGSKVEQKFSEVYGFNAEEVSHVIILRLSGVSGKVEINEPITVKTKTKCITCNKQNKANANFCSGCGTALNLL